MRLSFSLRASSVRVILALTVCSFLPAIFLPVAPCAAQDADVARSIRAHLDAGEFGLAQDLAGGLVTTLPSERDWNHPELRPLLDKYLKGREGVPTEDRMRALRLIENMTMGRNAVGYLTESMHGAGSPQARRPPAAERTLVGWVVSINC